MSVSVAWWTLSEHVRRRSSMRRRIERSAVNLNLNLCWPSLLLGAFGRQSVRVDNKFENYTIVSDLPLPLNLFIAVSRLSLTGWTTPSRPFSCFLMWWACRLDCHSDSSVTRFGPSIALALLNCLQLKLQLKLQHNSTCIRPLPFALSWWRCCICVFFV